MPRNSMSLSTIKSLINAALFLIEQVLSKHMVENFAGLKSQALTHLTEVSILGLMVLSAYAVLVLEPRTVIFCVETKGSDA